MCYSAEASFVSGVVLMGAGAWCLHRARSRAPWFWPYAIVPCLFAVQQFAEGVVWIGLHHENKTLIENGSAVYLFFALAFWPFWFSFAAWKTTTISPARRFLRFWTIASTIWFFVFFLPALGSLDHSAVAVAGHSVRYEYPDSGGMMATSSGRWIQRTFYLLTGLIPTMVMSERKLLYTPAFLATLSAIAAALYFDQTFTSVWCLWAAFISISLLRSSSFAADMQRSPHNSISAAMIPVYMQLD